jgi:hypothetical protein
MQNEKDILSNFKNHKANDAYDVPSGYFNKLNDRIFDEINRKAENATKVLRLNVLLKYAASITLLIGFYFVYTINNPSIEINYADLNESIDEYMSSEDELFYTFASIDIEESTGYLDLEENISDYLEPEIY